MSVDPRQGPLTDELRCYYDDERHRRLRPHCDGVAVVAYGTIRLCATCDRMRSAVGGPPCLDPSPATNWPNSSTPPTPSPQPNASSPPPSAPLVTPAPRGPKS